MSILTIVILSTPIDNKLLLIVKNKMYIFTGTYKLKSLNWDEKKTTRIVR